MQLGTVRVLAMLAIGLPQVAAAQQMIIDGGFEGLGAGWNVYVAPGSSHPTDRYYLSAGGASPVSGSTLPGAAEGSLYAVSDQTGPGAGALYQSFALAAPVNNATLTFWMFIGNAAGVEFNTGNLDYTGDANQHARVDLLSGVPSDLLTTGGDVLFNMFAGGTSFGWTFFSFDLTPYLQSAGTYTLRFAEVDNQLFFNQGVDGVSLELNTVPEPATLTLFGLGSMAIAAVRRRRTLA